jgi:hypothetical protein
MTPETPINGVRCLYTAQKKERNNRLRYTPGASPSAGAGTVSELKTDNGVSTVNHKAFTGLEKN